MIIAFGLTEDKSHLNILEQVRLDDLMTFVVTFMLSTDYVKNPYLRAKLVEVCDLYFFYIIIIDTY